MLEYLEEAGDFTDITLCNYRERGLQMNAYSIRNEFKNIDIFVSIFNDNEVLSTVTKTEIDVALKRSIQIFRKAINQLYSTLKKDNDTYEFALALNQHRNKIEKVRIVAITNCKVGNIPFHNINIDNTEVSFIVWDIERLFRCISSGKMREVIQIDLIKKYNVGILP